MLLERLNTDRSIAHLVAQFVPLKIDTETAEWQEWARKYPHEGMTIPIVYAVRSDGELMYGRSGSLRGPDLPNMMTTMLLTAGRILTDDQINMLNEALEKAESAMEAGNRASAVKALLPIRKMGPLGQLGSFAAAARKCDLLVAQLTRQGKQTLDELNDQIASGQPDFKAVLTYLQARRTYAQLPTLKDDVAYTTRSYERQRELRELILEARALDRVLELTEEDHSKAKGMEALEEILAKSPGTLAAEAALARLNELRGVVIRATDDARNLIARTWTDASGTNQVQATLIGIQDDFIVLHRTDNRSVNVPIAKLSSQDQVFVKFMRLRFERDRAVGQRSD